VGDGLSAGGAGGIRGTRAEGERGRRCPGFRREQLSSAGSFENTRNLVGDLLGAKKCGRYSRAQAQQVGVGVGGILLVLGGCAQAHPPDVAPELVSELETRSRAFFCNCSHCSRGGFAGAVTAIMATWAQ
jgi:hypothetical protein